MALILVDGCSGSGKSTVLSELRARGYQAYGTDEDSFALWHDKTTGRFEELDQEAYTSAELRDLAFYEHYEWALVRERVAGLSAAATGQLVFLCGGGRLFDCWELFSAVLVLSAPLEVVLARIDTRSNNNFGRSALERDWVVDRHTLIEQRYRAAGATFIDSTAPPERVVDDVVASARRVVRGGPLGP
jgi:thymidylate kinase